LTSVYAYIKQRRAEADVLNIMDDSSGQVWVVQHRGIGDFGNSGSTVHIASSETRAIDWIRRQERPAEEYWGWYAVFERDLDGETALR
jgi:hypothetical protein